MEENITSRKGPDIYASKIMPLPEKARQEKGAKLGDALEGEKLLRENIEQFPDRDPLSVVNRLGATELTVGDCARDGVYPPPSGMQELANRRKTRPTQEASKYRSNHSRTNTRMNNDGSSLS